MSTLSGLCAGDGDDDDDDDDGTFDAEEFDDFVNSAVSIK